MMRSTFSRPVALSSSYLTLEPRGISMTAWKSRGNSLPGEISCHAWVTRNSPRIMPRKQYERRSFAVPNDGNADRFELREQFVQRYHSATRFPEVPLKRLFLFSISSAFACVFLAVGLQAQPVPEHPLDALTTQEYWTVYEVLTGSGNMDSDTHFMSILLHEPSKSLVLAWKPGSAVPREADVILLRKERVIEARVDIAAKKVKSWKEIPGAQGPIFDSEINGISETILADERVQKALDKRGITDKNVVECAAVPVGFFAFPEQKDHRIGFADCSVKHGSYHSWSRYVGGLVIEVDFAAKKVMQVFDDGVVPVAEPSNYEETPEVPRPGTKPAIVSQPLGPSFQINHGEISWQNWHFRLRLDSRVGPVLNLVSIDDGGRRRSILYEGSWSELFVPYMDATRNWSTRAFIDAGEFYPGGTLKSLRPGLDCPSNAAYLDGLSTDEKGAPVLRPRQACLFERFAGDVA